MTIERFFLFPPFEVDTGAGSLLCHGQEVVLRAKTFALLCYLLEHPGQLATKEEILNAIWPDTYVAEGVLTVCITELRKALGDDSKQPRFIATVPKRGYRFIAEVVRGQQSVVSSQEEESQKSKGKSQKFSGELPSPPPNFVGRDAELTALHNLFAKACAGQRQVVFVTGEPGIGKTTLVDAFLQSLASKAHGQADEQQRAGSTAQGTKRGTVFPALSPVLPALCYARGQCIEHYGIGEAYLPLHDALGQLCRNEGGEKVVELLSRYAPTWVAQMPDLFDGAELDAAQKRSAGATRERMLRELTGALEALTMDRPLILILEDLHWSDYSTVDLVSFIARRQSPAQLMIIGTYRPEDVLQREHPLLAVKQELQLHGHCEELGLTSLTQADVGEYLARQFPTSDLSAQLQAVVHQRTEGNPLFMVNVIQELVEQKVIAQQEDQWALVGTIETSVIPVGLRQFIEQQVTRIKPEERALLEAASVGGVEFSVAAVAAALGEEIVKIEMLCETLARRRQFVHSNGVRSWPDGTAAGCYRFLHALYQEVLYEQISAGRRVGLHRCIGERLEAAYGNRTKEVAVELAAHFEQGQDIKRAVQYLGQAGENALARNAHVEAIALLNRAIALLQTLPDTPERAQQELGLYLLLRTPLAFAKGYVAPELEHAYARAYELCQQVGETPQLFMVLGGPYALHLLRAELPAAHRVAEERMRLAESVPFDLFLQVAHFSLGIPLLFMGEFARARDHLEQSVTLYKPGQLGALGHLYDPGVMSLSQLAFVLWLLGYPDQALQRSQETLALARQLSHPFSLAYALGWAARIHRLRGEEHASQPLEEEWIALCTDQGFTHQLAMATISQGWGLVEQGHNKDGGEQIRRGLTDYRATGEALGASSYLILLSEAYGKAGNVAEARQLFTEAEEFIHTTEERFWEAELYRLQGEMALQQANQKAKGKKQRETRGLRLETSPSSPQASSLKSLAPSGVASGAETHFLKAIAIAREQQAKSFELRAMMSLVRLRQQQALQSESPNTQHVTRSLLAEAHSMLSELYVWFTEGFATKDLQEAKALLHAFEQQSGAETVPSTGAEPETPPPALRLVVNKQGRR